MDQDKGQGGPAAPEPDDHPQPQRARWLIYAREHKAFWRPMQMGYTTDLEIAGRYTTTEAMQLVTAARGLGKPRGLAPDVMLLAPEIAPAAVLLESLDEKTQIALTAFLTTTAMGEADANSHGPLDLRKLVEMLLQDVALAIHRPGSWEGDGMNKLLSGHGYVEHQHDAICEALRAIYWGGRERDPYRRKPT